MFEPILAALVLNTVPAPGPTVGPADAPYTTWSAYGGSRDSMQYSALRQIDRTNVAKLDVAWTHEVAARTARVLFNPLIADSVMYVIGKDDAIEALDAGTGRPLWSHPTRGLPPGRGLSYWESRDGKDRRILFTTDNTLRAIDARTGQAIRTFGRDGQVDISEGVPRADQARELQSQTPGRVFENLILLGSATGEEYDAPPGDVRAYDVVTGALAWTFHTIPRPGEHGHDTWPKDAWKEIGGVNVWGEISVDEARGIAFVPTGSPTYDFYGANRRGANLFANCLLALDVRTGKRLWHFQAVHHDLWDYDLAAAPKLLTVRHGGKDVDVVAQAAKSGHVFVFRRDTGEPLWPIEERPVPQSDVPGEFSWPTQPFPSRPEPISRQHFPADELNPHVDDEEKARLRERVLAARNEGIYTPPSLRGTINVPGHWGGFNWGAGAADPQTGMLYLRSLDIPTFSALSTQPDATLLPALDPGTKVTRGASLYRRSCFACHGMTLPSARVLTPEVFREAVVDGVARMPAFPHLTVNDTTALFEYVTALNEQPADKPSSGTAAPNGATAAGPTRYYGASGQVMLTDKRLPVVAPPWAELVALDLNEGAIRWRVPFGTVPQLAARGIKDTGGSWLGVSRNGPVVTAGGLIFAATGADRTIRAYDKDTGRVLWEKEVEHTPVGIPAVYETGGRQHVAFTARMGPSGASKQHRRSYYVFALPTAKPE